MPISKPYTRGGTPEERFWRFVQRTQAEGCWLWQGTVTRYGYGQLCVSREPTRYKLAHRLSYEIHKRPIKSTDVVRHSCDVRLCVNPRHLTVGTHSENHADMVAKGRNRSSSHVGFQNPNVKLTADDVRRIRASPLSHSKIAAEFGVSKGTAAAIRSRRIWSHLE